MRRAGWWVAVASVALHVAGSHLPVTLATPPPAPVSTFGDVVFLGAIMTPELIPAGRAAPRGPSLEPDPLAPEPLAGLWTADTALMPPLPSPLLHMEKPSPRAGAAVAAGPRRATAPVWIRGPARLRPLQHRPPLEPYLQRIPITRLRARTAPSAVELELRFLVSADGAVRQVEILRSTGDPLIDLIGSQYLADWRFAPLDRTSPGHGPEPWGRVTLRLELGSA